MRRRHDRVMLGCLLLTRRGLEAWEGGVGLAGLAFFGGLAEDGDDNSCWFSAEEGATTAGDPGLPARRKGIIMNNTLMEMRRKGRMEEGGRSSVRQHWRKTTIPKNDDYSRT